MPVFSPSRNAAIHSLCCRVGAENWLDAQLWIWIHSDPDTFIKQNPDLATILQFIKLLLSLVEGYGMSQEFGFQFLSVNPYKYIHTLVEKKVSLGFK